MAGGSGNPIGPGTANVTVNLAEDDVVKLRKLAKESNMLFTAYCRSVLVSAARQGILATKVEAKLSEDPIPYRTSRDRPAKP